MGKRKELPIVWDIAPLSQERAGRLLRFLLREPGNTFQSTRLDVARQPGNTKPAAESGKTRTRRASERGSERAAGL